MASEALKAGAAAAERAVALAAPTSRERAYVTAERIARRFGYLPLTTPTLDRLEVFAERADDPLYVGRPNTWGQRSANIILQQLELTDQLTEIDRAAFLSIVSDLSLRVRFLGFRPGFAGEDAARFLAQCRLEGHEGGTGPGDA